jgi:hypothetical protein
MIDSNEPEPYEQEVLRQMEAKETDELMQIWRENDREAWTEEAFDAVRKILLERLGDLPAQGLPEEEESAEDESEEDGRLILPYPTDKKLIWIADWSNRLSGVVLAVGIIEAVIRFISIVVSPNPNTALSIFLGLIVAVTSVLSYGFIYLVMQAIAEIIYLLLDIRELSRPGEAQLAGVA